MKDVKPTSLLKDRVREVEGNPDFSNKDASVAQPPVLAEVKPGVVPVLNQVEEVNNTSYASGHPSLANQVGFLCCECFSSHDLHFPFFTCGPCSIRLLCTFLQALLWMMTKLGPWWSLNVFHLVKGWLKLHHLLHHLRWVRCIPY